MINKQLLSILACPVTKAPLTLSADETELLCTASRLAYPINDGIPVLLEEQARKIELEEYETLTK